MRGIRSTSKKVILSLLEKEIEVISGDQQAYAQLQIGAESIANHLSLSIIEEMPKKWLLTMALILSQLEQQAQLPYLKRAVNYSTRQLMNELQQLSMLTAETL